MEQAPQKMSDSSLKTRLRSALILAPIVLLVLYVGKNSYAFMMAAIAGVGVYEWTKMVLTGAQKEVKNFEGITAGVAALGTITAAMVGNPVLSFWFLLALCFMVFAYNHSKDGPSVRQVLLGLVYIGFSCAVMIWLRNKTDHGLYHTLTLLFIIWASDSSAYFFGRAIGGPKLAPSISPKKTWAGFWGSSLGAGLVAAMLAGPWVTGYFNVTPLGDMGMMGYFILGFILAMFGQVGDLMISIFKRHYGVKDTGNIIPGHGGILDRVDALLLVALIFGIIAKVAGA